MEIVRVLFVFMDLLIRRENRILTRDRFGTGSVYGEKLEAVGGGDYREWIPWRSKMGALLKKREEMEFPKGDVLYLGAAQGTTVSHISDLLPHNMIYAVEFSPVAFRKLASTSRKRNNLVPVLADAFHPERYRSMVPAVDIIYQDVSQKDQVGMLLRNAEQFLKNEGTAILMLKARSVDVTMEPSRIYERAVSELKKGGMKIELLEDLSPFQADHAAIMMRYMRQQ